ncbi:bifunctional molybdenum cofactor biosynthesis protein MoaC/MoaB [Sphingobacterium shayense]|uniref:bifunctional molybdenum cofactor biosynthesis protein MoaC/MoaB n=1 Tax=Sphingobacterium shayense TaxID=626343 RepID=UPI0015525B1D|nr:bifunctional molybdenum cofactor biosynthesis protein MoaC/MoaB [Sphingobacterium shayense]NQD69428.1 bifunctional molybdenum cofactor biosynthesis protein MoaC/MoaB [Sphingobacterium shayense]
MVEITFKNYTLRKAIAAAKVTVTLPQTMDAIKSKSVPKGDIFEFARASALLAIKKTSDMIPDCHPLPVEYAAIRYSLDDLSINIEVEVHTIYKTGVEVEAMHGASIAALVIYDMLKPIDKGIQISDIRLIDKKGGKSNASSFAPQTLKAAIVVCSDSVFQEKKQDQSGKAIVSILQDHGFNHILYSVVPDEKQAIAAKLETYKSEGVNLLIFTGGTGLSVRDVTPEAVKPYLTTEIPGIMENARSYGQQRIGTAMLSRSIAGFSDDMFVLTLPGSENAVREYMATLFPHVLHVFDVRGDNAH